jgi:hypothetical protein
MGGLALTANHVLQPTRFSRAAEHERSVKRR